MGTVEGYSCCKAAWELRKKLNVEMPITEQLHKILFEDGTVKEALENLMSRPNRHETEGIFIRMQELKLVFNKCNNALT